MATKQDIGFASPTAIIAPDIAVQQQQIARKQAIIDALREQGMQQIDGGRGSISWTQGLAKLADALAARSMQKKVDQQTVDINRAYADRMGAMFGIKPQYGAPPAQQAAAPPQSPAAQQPPADPSATGSAPVPPSPQSPEAAGPSSYPMSLSGNPGQDFTDYVSNPQAYTEAMIKAHSPVDMARTVQQAQAAMGRGDIATAQALLSNVQKENYIAPANMRGGSWTIDPHSGKRSYNPQLPEGSEPVFDSAGNVVGVKAINGSISLIGQVEGAKAGARAAAEAPYQTVETYNPDTGEYELHPKTVVTGGGGGGSGGSLNGYYGAQGGGRGGSVVSKPGPGSQAATTTAGTNSANQFNDAVTAGANTQNANRLIDNILAAAHGLPTGTGSETISHVKSGVNAITGAMGMGPVFDPKQVAAFDEINKNAAALGLQLSQAAGQGTTDARLKTALDALPNSHYSPAAIQEVGLNLKALNAAAQARAQAASAWQQQHGPSSYPQFQTQWQRAYDPEIFYRMQQGPQAFGKWAQSLPAAKRAETLGKYRAMKGMGAF